MTCNANSATTTLHGTFISVFGVGCLITGEPGIGKSELALGLINRHHQLIADDAPVFIKENNWVSGENLLRRPFLLVRGIGLIDVVAMFGESTSLPKQTLHLIIQLKIATLVDTAPCLESEMALKDVLGCLIPCVTIPIINPRNLEVLVEAIVRNHLLTVNQGKIPLNDLAQLLHQKMESNHS